MVRAKTASPNSLLHKAAVKEEWGQIATFMTNLSPTSFTWGPRNNLLICL